MRDVLNGQSRVEINPLLASGDILPMVNFCLR